MSVSSGTRLGAYEVGSLPGVGGMGEVYRARDTKLDRDVAIKVLPASFAAIPHRVARFEREAKTQTRARGRVNREELAEIDLHWHDLRHKAACRWLSRGLDLRAIQLLPGHADRRRHWRRIAHRVSRNRQWILVGEGVPEHERPAGARDMDGD